MTRRARLTTRWAAFAVLALAAASSPARDDRPAEARTLRFDWSVPARVGVTQLDDDSLQCAYDIVVERGADAGLRERTEAFRITEYGGRSADSPVIAPQVAFIQTFLAGRRPDVVLDADARATDAPDALRRLVAAIDELAASEDPDAVRVARALREQVDSIRSDPVLERSLRDRAMAWWQWSVGAWVGLPVRAGTVFEGDLDLASEIDGVATSTMRATITAGPVEGAANRWQFDLVASSEGERATAALTRGPLDGAAEAIRRVEISVVLDVVALRPSRVTYVESLEATLRGDSSPRRKTKRRTLDFAWEPLQPAAALREEDAREAARIASAYVEAWRQGDAETLLELAPPARREQIPSDAVVPWPESWSWKRSSRGR